jgi:hypothetical protein
VSAPAPLFRFSQVELPWALGPPDGRYLLRASDREPGRARTPADSAPPQPGTAPTHVLVFATLGAPQRRRLDRARPQRKAEPEPQPEPVITSRATVIDVGEPFGDLAHAQAWLQTAGEPDLLSGLAVLNRVLYTFRLVSADPYLHVVSRQRVLVARIGFGAGEQVAEGLWTDALELVSAGAHQRRARMLAPQAGFAAVLAGRRRTLVCEELTLRARLDVDHGHYRQAALQVLVALDAVLAELPLDPTAPALAERLEELRGQRDAMAGAGQAALAGPLGEAHRQAVVFTLSRIEAALRARAVAGA